MKLPQLSFALPPFARDFSGVCSAFFPYGGMVVIHGSYGCTGNYVGFDESRWYGSESEIVGSGLLEQEAVCGHDHIVIEKIIKSAQKSRPKFICITGTAVPMLTGIDHEGIACEIEAQTGIPSVGFATSGLGFYDVGVSAALLRLMDLHMKEGKGQRPPTIPKSFNILGANSIDYNLGEAVESCISRFEERGYELVCSLAMGRRFDRVADMPRAQVNIVVSQSGLQAAQRLFCDYQIPYVEGLPIGGLAAERFFDDVERAVSQRCCFPLQELSTEDLSGRVLIVGERSQSNSLARYLLEDCGCSEVDVCTVFSPAAKFGQRERHHAACESELIEVLKRSKARLIIADPLLRLLLDKSRDVQFIDLPTPSISGRLKRAEYKTPFDLTGLGLANIIKTLGGATR